MGVLTALAILAGLIVVHEAGHFFAATWQGIRVSSFSIGFGPVLFERQRRGVQFALRAIPRQQNGLLIMILLAILFVVPSSITVQFLRCPN